ncbi:MAG: DUF3429 domain-containing protein [Pseudorhodobacter sp.]|nr:DUF3429 domain-containing protein [Pseudorhodobacter sp.]
MIPRQALILGLAGLLPFLWSVATVLSPGLADVTLHWVGPRFVGPYVGLAYGTIILAFMSGTLWGFAVRATGGLYYALSVIPALWAFFLVGGGPEQATIWLALGFVGLLGFDWLFWRAGLAPVWWMRLRLILSAGVLASLAAALYA